MPKVMLIEDDVTMHGLLKAFLELEGFDVLDFDAQERYENVVGEIARQRPDLVLTDVNLREISGFDLLHRIRQQKEIQSTRVILSSGMDYHMEAYQAGADGFILKPYMPEELVKKFRELLGE